jgi:hypothetical protein
MPGFLLNPEVVGGLQPWRCARGFNVFVYPELKCRVHSKQFLRYF